MSPLSHLTCCSPTNEAYTSLIILQLSSVNPPYRDSLHTVFRVSYPLKLIKYYMPNLIYYRRISHEGNVNSCFILVSCLIYTSILKIDAKCSYETSAYFQWTTRFIFQKTKLLMHGEVKYLEITEMCRLLSLL